MASQLRLGFRHALLCWGHAKELGSATPIHDEAERAGGNRVDFALHFETSDTKHLACLQHRCRTKTVVLPNEAETRRYVRQCLKKRENAPKRIGIGYKVIQTDGMWEEFIEPKSP